MLQKVKYLLFTLCLFTCFCSLNAKIIETFHMQEMMDYLARDTLIIFDIDNTLMEPIQELGNDQWFYHRLENLEKNGVSYEKALDIALSEWYAIQNITKVKVVEEGTQEFLSSLEKQGYMIMGMTTRGLGLAMRTVEQLKSIGISLAPNAPIHKDVFFDNKQGVLFRDGILFTSGTHKGEALMKFLDIINYTPKHVVFINDKATHLRQTEGTVLERGIPFIGLRYGYLDEKVANFNPELADIQFKHFGFIMSDEEALHEMHSL